MNVVWRYSTEREPNRERRAIEQKKKDEQLQGRGKRIKHLCRRSRSIVLNPHTRGTIPHPTAMAHNNQRREKPPCFTASQINFTKVIQWLYKIPNQIKSRQSKSIARSTTKTTNQIKLSHREFCHTEQIETTLLFSFFLLFVPVNRVILCAWWHTHGKM